MADIKLGGKTFSGVEKINIPLADGSGYRTYSAPNTEGGTGGVTIENVSVLVADFAETESLTVLSGAYCGTKQAIVS